MSALVGWCVEERDCASKRIQWLEITICTRLDAVLMLKSLGGGGKSMDVAYGGGQRLTINLHDIWHPLQHYYFIE